MTKAEQLANICETAVSVGMDLTDYDDVAAELRRLAPMEAQNRKLLEQNLKLIDDLFGAKARVKELEDATRLVVERFSPVVEDLIFSKRVAMKLLIKALGETK